MAERKEVAENKNGGVLQGLLRSAGMTLVQKKKNFVGDKKSDGTQDYYYSLTVTDGEELLSCTSGKVADDMRLGHVYQLGFNYIDRKLKLISYRELTQS